MSVKMYCNATKIVLKIKQQISIILKLKEEKKNPSNRPIKQKYNIQYNIQPHKQNIILSLKPQNIIFQNNITLL